MYSENNTRVDIRVQNGIYNCEDSIYLPERFSQKSQDR
jgi:hypothetical protein